MNIDLPINTDYIQCHRAVVSFNYDLSVDWARELLVNGIETENILILASFQKPTDSIEIKNYVSAVLVDLQVKEKTGDAAELTHIHYLVRFLSKGENLRENLSKIRDLYWEYEIDKLDINKFYNLHHAWSDLEFDNFNSYSKEVTKKNIGSFIKKEAKLWIKKFIEKDLII